jgi:PKHD-type hydroxylase
MLLCVENVLTSDELASLSALLAQGRWEDGLGTVWAGAAKVKHNQQLAPNAPETRKAQEIVAQALTRNETFVLATRPKALLPTRFSRYEPGMRYGPHWDDALSRQPMLRYDVSYTLFLADPAGYDGGELVIEHSDGERPYKLPRGGMVLYPSNEVTRGERLAAVGWVQSLVRDAAKRELLYDLDMARRALFQREGKTREWDLLGKTFANLMRMWIET